MLPEPIHNILDNEHQITVNKTEPVSGGSINHACRLSTNKGIFFLKWNPSAPAGFFEKEAEGLQLLTSASPPGIRIPDVVAVDRTEPAGNLPGFLLMEWIRENRQGDAFAFGAELARLHQTHAEKFGLASDNYIGSLPQSNRRHSDWNSFFAEERIGIQLKRAVDHGRMDADILRFWNRLAAQLGSLLPPCKPSLLHGDLWGGNYLFDEQGKAVLIDPAVYYGHPEAELAFTKMFGGFPAGFYEGYEYVSPVPGNFDERVPIYNLYPLLVHANLFGGHYVSQSIRFLKRY